MPRITLEISEELSQQLAQVGDRLPELLALSLQQPAVPAQVYRYILDFLASNPTPEQIAEFKPTPEMQERLHTLLARSNAGEVTPTELKELDDFTFLELDLAGLTPTGRTTIRLLQINSDERLAERRRLR
ncbi:hypothetical protein [Nostoc sp.]|uniref:hypothetical protein n=1 Tax=Nostoc sp. TaxID=1180 RepID=UPI002FFA3E24